MKGKKASMPSSVMPMLATLIQEPVENADYVNEVKWDGYRVIAFKNKGIIRLDSRRGQNYTDRYKPVVSALRKLKSNVVLDGEVCVLQPNGVSNFDDLQKYPEKGGLLAYYCFDILWKDGYNLTELPLLQRKSILKKLLKNNTVIRYSDHFDDAAALLQQMKELEGEGIVSKKRDSTYKPGVRGYDWLKVPIKKRQEFVIAGWAESERNRSFRSIHFGAYNKTGQLEWVGRSGGGYKEKDMPGILQKLKSREIKKKPFVNNALDTKGAVMHWVKPELVGLFEFSGFTDSGRIRKPATWCGFRSDKNPRDVVREIPKEVGNGITGNAKTATGQKQQKKKQKKFPYLNVGSGWQAVDEEQKNAQWTELQIESCTIQVHNLERELWEEIPKGKLLVYYSEMAEILLPYLKDRPQSLNLKLTHAGAPRTFIKDMENRQPACAAIFTDKRRIKKAGKREQIDYLVCNNKATLMYMVDTGCVDINPWASLMQNPQYPTYISFDLDPTIPEKLKGKKLEKAEQDGFEQAIQVALACKKVFDKKKLNSYVKTSGKTGIHIYVPCVGFKFEEARSVANVLARQVHALVPEISTLVFRKELRENNVYIDTGQNDYADTLAAPYSVRPYHQPTVSTPLQWKEVKPGLDRFEFNINTIKKRFERKGDLFADVLSSAIANNNSVILKKL